MPGTNENSPLPPSPSGGPAIRRKPCESALHQGPRKKPYECSPIQACILVLLTDVSTAALVILLYTTGVILVARCMPYVTSSPFLPTGSSVQYIWMRIQKLRNPSLWSKFAISCNCLLTSSISSGRHESIEFFGPF